jgi:hypothetical protein
VLAALLFMAIVVPVAIEAMHIASLAGAVAARKSEAARIAQKVMNENLVTTNWNQSSAGGTVVENQRSFRWTMNSDNWREDPNQMVIRQLTVEVFYTAMGHKYSVKMSTLVDSSAAQ